MEMGNQVITVHAQEEEEEEKKEGVLADIIAETRRLGLITFVGPADEAARAYDHAALQGDRARLNFGHDSEALGSCCFNAGAAYEYFQKKSETLDKWAAKIRERKKAARVWLETLAYRAELRLRLRALLRARARARARARRPLRHLDYDLEAGGQAHREEATNTFGQAYAALLPASAMSYSAFKDAPEHVKVIIFGGLVIIYIVLIVGMLSRSLDRRQLAFRLVSCSAVTLLTFSVASQLSERTYVVLTALVGGLLNLGIMLLRF